MSVTQIGNDCRTVAVEEANVLDIGSHITGGQERADERELYTKKINQNANWLARRRPSSMPVP
jgi:hypothetical protein